MPRLRYRLGLLAADEVVVELKCVRALEPIHTAQILNYLRLTDRQVGLLIKFNVPLLREGIRRVLV